MHHISLHRGKTFQMEQICSTQAALKVAKHFASCPLLPLTFYAALLPLGDGQGWISALGAHVAGQVSFTDVECGTLMMTWSPCVCL